MLILRSSQAVAMSVCPVVPLPEPLLVSLSPETRLLERGLLRRGSSDERGG